MHMSRYHNIARRFFEKAGMKSVALLSADGALEAAPAMGSADIILDLVSTGVFKHECRPPDSHLLYLGLSCAFRAPGTKAPVMQQPAFGPTRPDRHARMPCPYLELRSSDP